MKKVIICSPILTFAFNKNSENLKKMYESEFISLAKESMKEKKF